MKNLKEELKYGKKGITLISLVVTIIILLILAGVTIATLTGDNGILNQATKAKEETQKASEDELRKLTILEATSHLEEYEYEDPSGAKITIPAKCAVSQVEGESAFEDGLVIIDANGNEWVWVEVPRTEEVYPNIGINLDVNNITDEQCTTIYEDLAIYTSAYRQDGYEDTFYSTEQSGFDSAESYNKARNNMLRSIYINGGFWIGRYEVGDAEATENNITRTESTGTSDKAVVQANQIPYNYITCEEASKLSSSLSIGEKISSLIFGIQWDLTCKFLEVKTTLDEKDINSDSRTWGNFRDSSVIVSRGKYNVNPSQGGIWTSILDNNINNFVGNSTNSDINYFQQLTTGASDTTKKMNIYDFAGNVAEWTLESSMTQYIPCVIKGGQYWSRDFTDEFASYRERLGTNNTADSWGFRATLY